MHLSIENYNDTVKNKTYFHSHIRFMTEFLKYDTFPLMSREEITRDHAQGGGIIKGFPPKYLPLANPERKTQVLHHSMAGKGVCLSKEITLI